MRHRTILNLPTVNNIPYNVTTDGYLDTLVNQLNITIDEALYEYKRYINITRDNDIQQDPQGKALVETGEKIEAQQEKDKNAQQEARTKDMGFFRKAWEKIKAFFAKIWNWVSGLFSNYRKKLDEIINKLKVVNASAASQMQQVKAEVERRFELSKNINEVLVTDPGELTETNSYANAMVLSKLGGQYIKGCTKDLDLSIRSFDGFTNVITASTNKNSDDGDKITNANSETLTAGLLAAIDNHKECNEYYKNLHAAITKLHNAIVLNNAKEKTIEESKNTLLTAGKEFIKEVKNNYNNKSEVFKLINTHMENMVKNDQIKEIDVLGVTKSNPELYASIVLDGFGVFISKKNVDHNAIPNIDVQEIKEGMINFNTVVFVIDENNGKIITSGHIITLEHLKQDKSITELVKNLTTIAMGSGVKKDPNDSASYTQERNTVIKEAREHVANK